MEPKVTIYQEPYSDSIFISIGYRDGHRLFLADPVELIFREYELGMKYEPTLSLNWAFAREFLKALAEELDKAGVKTDSDAKMQGILEAQKYHLEDLRTMLKLKKQGK